MHIHLFAWLSGLCLAVCFAPVCAASASNDCRADDQALHVADTLDTLPWVERDLLYRCPNGSMSRYRLVRLEKNAQAAAGVALEYAAAVDTRVIEQPLTLNADSFQDLHLEFPEENGVSRHCLLAGCGSNWFTPVLYLEDTAFTLSDLPSLHSGRASWKAVIVPGRTAEAPDSARYLFDGRGYARQIDVEPMDRVLYYASNRDDRDRRFLAVSSSGRVSRRIEASEFRAYAHVPPELDATGILRLMPALASPWGEFSLPAIRLDFNSDVWPDYIQPTGRTSGFPPEQNYLFLAGIGSGLTVEVHDELLPEGDVRVERDGVDLNGILWHDLNVPQRYENNTLLEASQDYRITNRFIPSLMGYYRK